MSTSSQRRYFIETLGCPKNQVDSDKLEGTLKADGLIAAEGADSADLVVINTCAFIDEAREESVNTILELEAQARPDAKLVVTGCLAERYQGEIAEAIPRVDEVAGFGTPVSLSQRPAVPRLDLLNLPRPKATRPWAYVKIAEGCDRKCGFCAIPSFRGPQRSRSIEEICAEVAELDVTEVVLVAQDLASFGRDQGQGERRIRLLVEEVSEIVDWVRLLYLYPSDLKPALIETMLEHCVPYFDLSLQHVAAPLLRKMRRWGSGDIFVDRIDEIRQRAPEAALRSNFIVGYPGERERDHDELLSFVEAARLDWCGFFSYSEEEGTFAAGLDQKVPAALMGERLAELRDLQDRITEEKRDEMIGAKVQVLVEAPGVGRSHKEAPEIDGIIEVPRHLDTGGIYELEIVASKAPDLVAREMGVAGGRDVVGIIS